MTFSRQDFDPVSVEDVWEIVPAGGQSVVGPISLADRYLIVHEYRERWNCRVQHEIPYDQIARRMRYPAEVAALLDGPPGNRLEEARQK